MTKVYAIDGVIPVVAPSAFVHPTAALTEPTGARLEIAGSRPLHTIARDGGTDGAS